MEYEEYIDDNIAQLIKLTDCNVLLLAKLISAKAISSLEADVIRSIPTSAAKSFQLWEYLKKKSDQLQNCIGIFAHHDICQKPVADILKKANRDDKTDNKKPLTVKVVKPREKVVHENDAYKLDPDKIGLALVINITQFDDKDKNRTGADNDFTYMKELWTQLGYTVSAYNGYFKQQRLNQVVTEFLKKFQKLDFSMSCVVYIGTHGTNGRLQLSDGKFICAYEDFIFKFTKDITLGDIQNGGLSKPKIFFMQSCQNLTPEKKNVLDLSHIADAIVCYPSLPGDSAKRDTELGSWFVYALTEVFMQEAHKTELMEMLKMVRRRVLTGMNSTDKEEQIPYWLDLKLKPLFFNVAPEETL